MRAVGWYSPASITLLTLFARGRVLLLVFTALAVLVARRPNRRGPRSSPAHAREPDSLALPIAALISFLVGGAQIPAGSARAGLTAVILGVRLTGNVATVGVSVGGLLAGVFLVFLGDRVLRQVRQARRGRADAAATAVVQGPFLQ